MARSANNNALSGVLGNVVFVNQGARSYIRSKPHKVRQNIATKAAASSFGWVSQQDKKYRTAVIQAYPLVTDRYYSARHRACMAKALGGLSGAAASSVSLDATLPEALVNFEFNAQLPWSKTCHFYATFSQDDNTINYLIPPLNLGQQLKAPEAVRAAHLQFNAFMVNPTQQDVDVTPLGTQQLTLLPSQTIPETIWTFEMPTTNAWVLVLGSVAFDYRQANVPVQWRGAATYAFAKVV
jgi:hypothetical protein